MSWRDWLGLLILGAIWGSSFTFNEIIIQAVEPLTAALFRVGLAALGAWALVVILRRSAKVPMPIFWLMLIAGAVTFTVPFAIFPLVQQELTSGEAAIANAFTPLMFVIVSHFWIASPWWEKGERATARRLAGVLLGMVGVALLSLPKLLEGANAEFSAMLISLIAPLFYAIGGNLSSAFKKIDPAVTTAYTLSGATLSAVPLVLIFETVPLSFTGLQWFAFLWIGLVGTAFAFQIMYMMLPRVGPTRFSTVTFFAPIFTLIFGALFLNESVDWIQLLGMATIFSGLMLINIQRKT